MPEADNYNLGFFTLDFAFCRRLINLNKKFILLVFSLQCFSYFFPRCSCRSVTSQTSIAQETKQCMSYPPDVVLRFQSKVHLPSERDLAGLLFVSFSSVVSGSLFSWSRPFLKKKTSQSILKNELICKNLSVMFSQRTFIKWIR